MYFLEQQLVRELQHWPPLDGTFMGSSNLASIRMHQKKPTTNPNFRASTAAAATDRSSHSYWVNFVSPSPISSTSSRTLLSPQIINKEQIITDKVTEQYEWKF